MHQYMVKAVQAPMGSGEVFTLDYEDCEYH